MSKAEGFLKKEEKRQGKVEDGLQRGHGFRVEVTPVAMRTQATANCSLSFSLAGKCLL